MALPLCANKRHRIRASGQGRHCLRQNFVGRGNRPQRPVPSGDALWLTSVTRHRNIGLIETVRVCVMRYLCLFMFFFVMFSAEEQAAAELVAKVDISRQTMAIIKNGRVIRRWPVSTGRKPYRTPVGSYRPTRMHVYWESRKYDRSPMPHSIFFRGGYAIHGTYHVRSLGRPASHGCIRLRPANAKELFYLVKANGRSNTRIVVQH